MARTSIFSNIDIPQGVMEIVRAVCADYWRRAREIKDKTKSEEILECYIDLNDKIDRGLADVEQVVRQDFLADIVNHRGWSTSRASIYGTKKWYYKRKKHVIVMIAKNLHLI